MSNQTKVTTPMEYIKVRRLLSDSWYKAAGLMKHKRKALERHIKRVESEWDSRSSHP